MLGVQVPRKILGVNLFHGDSSAALLVDGELVSAIEEERITRIKHAAGVPYHAVAAVLEEGGLTLDNVDLVAVGRDNRAHSMRKATWLARHAHVALPNAWQKLQIRREAASLPQLLAAHFGVDAKRLAQRFRPVEHHLAHLASAYHLSGFSQAAVLSVDGFGDFVSTMWASGSKAHIRPFDTVFFPHSLGILYQAVTQYIGYHHYGDEGKVMGLAPYGEPRYEDRIRSKLIAPQGAGGFVLAPRYFTHAGAGVETDFSAGAPQVGALYTDDWRNLFDRPARSVEEARAEPLDRWARDMSASVQRVVESYVFRAAKHARAQTRANKICLAGGVALNSVANGKLTDHVPFDEIYVQPAAGDDGIAIGAAAYLWRLHGGAKMKPLRVPYTGPAWSNEHMEKVLTDCGLDLQSDDPQLLAHDEHEVQVQIKRYWDEQALCDRVAAEIADEKVVGWFHGRMEFGPRALGARSILADPRSPNMKDILNQRIKHREIYRPFAPSILEAAVADWFEKDMPSPAMLMVYPIKPSQQARVPAITHVDGTGRLQTVSDADAPRYARLIRSFEAITGVPILLNTSFNENEPIVYRPVEAVDCFARTRMDVLVLEDYVITRVHI